MTYDKAASGTYVSRPSNARSAGRLVAGYGRFPVQTKSGSSSGMVLKDKRETYTTTFFPTSSLAVSTPFPTSTIVPENLLFQLGWNQRTPGHGLEHTRGPRRLARFLW